MGDGGRILGKGVHMLMHNAGATELNQEHGKSVNYLIYFESFQKSCVSGGFLLFV